MIGRDRITSEKWAESYRLKWKGNKAGQKER